MEVLKSVCKTLFLVDFQNNECQKLRNRHFLTTLQEKQIENALSEIVGDQPPHDLTLNHKEESLYDMLVASVRAGRESHFELDQLDVHTETNQSGHDHHIHNNEEHKHHNMRSHDHHTMKMWFHWGFDEVVLFDFWRIDDKNANLFFFFVNLTRGGRQTIISGKSENWQISGIEISGKSANRQLPTCRICRKNGNLPKNFFMKDGRALREDFKDNNASSPLVNHSRSTTPEVRHPGPLSVVRLTQAVLYIVQLVFAYWLMLIVMTYNIWLTLAVILGAGFGHWIFAVLHFANPNGEAADSIATDACH
eukprot:NP_510665.2 Uncharacterized protein CELE_F01G12.1 [Caenorhabditis elegans]